MQQNIFKLLPYYGNMDVSDSTQFFMDYDNTLDIRDVTHIEYVKEHGLQPYFYKLTIYIPVACLDPKEKDVTVFEAHYEWTARMYMQTEWLQYRDNPQWEIDMMEMILVMLTNAIGVLRGELQMGTSTVVTEWGERVDAFQEKMMQREKRRDDHDNLPYIGG